MYYASLAQARSELDMQLSSSGEPSEAINDAYLLEAIRVATKRIDAQLHPRQFLPYMGTKYFDALGHHIDDQLRMLELSNAQGRHPLLSATTVVDGVGNTLTLNTDYRMYPRGATPAFYLHLLNGGSWSDFGDEWVEAIAITGTWGYHSRYSEAWLSSGDTVQDNPLTNSATTLTVNAVQSNNLARFSAGQLLQIESEWLEVSATDSNTNTLTVKRGVRGTTAAQHAQGTAISIFSVEDAINRAAWRLAAFLYVRRGAFDRARYDGVATLEFPDDMPGEIENILALYSDKGWSTP